MTAKKTVVTDKQASKETKRITSNSEAAKPSVLAAQRVITDEKLAKYFAITHEALGMARGAIDRSTKEREALARDFLDMAQRYYDDAGFFEKKGDVVNAFAALNYAHGWLDAGARSRLFKVNDSRLFTVDEK